MKWWLWGREGGVYLGTNNNERDNQQVTNPIELNDPRITEDQPQSQKDA